MQVEFKHSAPECYDLVVSAGGLHSPVRELIFGPEVQYEKYLGYYAASFAVEGYPRRDARAYVTYATPGRQVSRYSLRGDRTGFFLVFPNRPSWRLAAMTSMARSRYCERCSGRTGGSVRTF